MKKTTAALLIAFLFLSVHTASAAYNYVNPEKMLQWLTVNKPITIVDIQVEPEFSAHHIKGSIETHAYPVKSDSDKSRLNPAVSDYKEENTEAVVIVCPRGKGGAKRAYDYITSEGVPGKQVYILEGGMAKWPHKDWVATSEKN